MALDRLSEEEDFGQSTSLIAHSRLNVQSFDCKTISYTSLTNPTCVVSSSVTSEQSRQLHRETRVFGGRGKGGGGGGGCHESWFWPTSHTQVHVMTQKGAAIVHVLSVECLMNIWA